MEIIVLGGWIKMQNKKIVFFYMCNILFLLFELIRTRGLEVESFYIEKCFLWVALLMYFDVVVFGEMDFERVKKTLKEGNNFDKKVLFYFLKTRHFLQQIFK